jgi:hypothetical protein
MLVATTRFTETTMIENIAYKERHNIHGVIYPCPMRINPKLQLDIPILVIEMNNSENKICGISIIRNKLVFNIHNVYSHTTFNRYVYRGNSYVSRDKMIEINNELVLIIDNLLFKGKTHQKRLQGISLLKEKLLTDNRLLGQNLHDELLKIIRQVHNK